MSLRIAKNLKLPDEAVTQTFAILAKRGVGKTYTASVMAEEMLKASLHVVIVDPIGVWWGLRSAANGKGAGLKIVIAGGDHADVPIDPSNGEVLADLVVNEKLSVVIDLSLFRKGEQVKFMTDFAETLYRRNRAALHLIVDEADAFAPQRAMPGQQRMLGAMEDLVRRGRARGIGVTLITQRPAVLNKDVLTQVEVLVTLRMIAPQDRKAIDDWVNVHGTPEQRDALMQSLPSLPIGTAWFWSPGWLDIFKRVEVRKRETLDSSSTPKIGQKITDARMADVDLDKVRKQLSLTIEKTEANDPKVLRRQIVKLERELAARKPETVVTQVEVIPHSVRSMLQLLKNDHENFGEHLQELEKRMDKFAPATDTPAPASLKPTINKLTDVRTVPKLAKVQISDNSEVNLKAGERRMLEALARSAPMKFTRAQVGTISRFKASGGTFGTYFGNLKRHGLIVDSNGEVTISDDGLAYLGEAPKAPMTTEEMIEMWRGALKAGERKMLDALVSIYPQSVDREVLGDQTGYAASGGTFGTYLGSLRRNGLIEVDGSEVRASDTLFMGGKA